MLHVSWFLRNWAYKKGKPLAFRKKKRIRNRKPDFPLTTVLASHFLEDEVKANLSSICTSGCFLLGCMYSAFKSVSHDHFEIRFQPLIRQLNSFFERSAEYIALWKNPPIRSIAMPAGFGKLFIASISFYRNLVSNQRLWNIFYTG